MCNQHIKEPTEMDSGVTQLQNIVATDNPHYEQGEKKNKRKKEKRKRNLYHLPNDPRNLMT